MIKNKILKNFLNNFLLSLVILILLFYCWLKWLELYTNHNELIKVPDFNEIHISDLDSIVNKYALKYVIIDSVFDNLKAKGIVVNQDPLPNTNVKRNRKIYLTINCVKPRMVYLPDVFDLTLRQAVSKLQKYGLEVGKLEYQPDIATNKVLAFKLNGIPIEIGQELYHGSVIDLVVGHGLSKQKVLIPNLIGLTLFEANILLKSNSLNLGIVYYNKDILDSNIATVSRQIPESVDDKRINLGSSIDLFFDHSNIKSIR